MTVVSAQQEHPYRVLFITAESAIALAAAVGSVQLVTGTFTPPVADLAALGLHSWVLPGLWLFASVSVPSGFAGWLAWRRSSRAPTAVMVASGLLLVELVVQIPFVGPSMLQAVMGTAAVGLAVVAGKARAWRAWGPMGASAL